MKIKVLSLDLINKIAAGEVIERPASVVKELVENSLDAGAKNITVKIKNSGRELISVSDDGCGMSKEDAVLSIERHSTSKISDITDLDKIHTLGFRGEALPSIASVSQMLITTKPPDTKTGFLLEIEDGKIVNLHDKGCPDGTTVEVKNIFQNIPARLKFLKSDNTEKNKIISILTDYAAVNFHVAFSLTSDGKELFSYSPATNLKIRIAQIFGNEFLNELIELHLQHEKISIYGFISKPEIKFSSRNRIFLSVNKRPINSRMILSAVKNGYGEVLQRNENPAVFLAFEIKPDIIDVNVHPTKREIKFKDEGAIYSVIYQTIRNHIITKETIPEISYTTPYQKSDEHISTQPTEYIAKEIQSQFSEKKPALQYIGRIFELYILAQENENLFIVDQHAAQEKILYEKFRKNADTRKPEIQNLLIPISIELSPKEFNILSGLKECLMQIGFELEEFGKNFFALKSVPAILGEASAINIINEIIRRKKVGEISETSATLLDDIIKTACKTAIKSGDKLSDTESIKLLEELFECENPYTCPHGRPTIIKITKDELDKKFLRK
ncbi:MAG: DNA mismatch repair protein MutL [Elusimicrobia bacterium CG06_land_8_20_14_3_00_38_11]|nr:MAG: DNA mismatch repair protein MutL [Elusimicrobia bacterium CG06_land_8_20_14_3_00_38_11]